VWLEEHLKHFKHILLLVSHSQDFLNGVCTNIIHLHHKHLKYYTGMTNLFLPPLLSRFDGWWLFVLGNYDQYVKTRAELEVQQMKRFDWEQVRTFHPSFRVSDFPFSYSNLLFRE
jgi:ATP-binding cassette subfamily F protein 2